MLDKLFQIADCSPACFFKDLIAKAKTDAGKFYQFLQTNPDAQATLMNDAYALVQQGVTDWSAWEQIGKDLLAAWQASQQS